jgi:hypothetical protein
MQVVQAGNRSGDQAGANLAYSVNQTSGPGWDILYADGSYDGNPALKTTGTVLGCYPHTGVGNCGTIANGVDLTKYLSITGNAFASNGFAIDGSGNLTAANVTSAWTSYTPTLTCSSGTLTTAAASGRYRQFGKTVLVFIEANITTNGSCATGLVATLPVTAAAFTYSMVGRENAVRGKTVFGGIGLVAANKVQMLNYDGSYPGATGARIDISGVYETP